MSSYKGYLKSRLVDYYTSESCRSLGIGINWCGDSSLCLSSNVPLTKKSRPTGQPWKNDQYFTTFGVKEAEAILEAWDVKLSEIIASQPQDD